MFRFQRNAWFDFGDDFMELLVFSTCLVRQWLQDMTSWSFSYSVQCSVRHWIHGAASLRGHSTGAALG